MWGEVPDLVNHATFRQNWLRGFGSLRGLKSAIFLRLGLWIIQQVRATAQPVIEANAHKIFCIFYS